MVCSAVCNAVCGENKISRGFCTEHELECNLIISYIFVLDVWEHIQSYLSSVYSVDFLHSKEDPPEFDSFASMTTDIMGYTTDIENKIHLEWDWLGGNCDAMESSMLSSIEGGLFSMIY